MLWQVVWIQQKSWSSLSSGFARVDHKEFVNTIHWQIYKDISFHKLCLVMIFFCKVMTFFPHTALRVIIHKTVSYN